MSSGIVLPLDLLFIHSISLTIQGLLHFLWILGLFSLVLWKKVSRILWKFCWIYRFFFNNIVTFTIFLNIGSLSSSIFSFFLQYFEDFITEVFFLLFKIYSLFCLFLFYFKVSQVELFPDSFFLSTLLLAHRKPI